MDREASDKEREKPLPTFKDNDFVKDSVKLYVKSDDKARVLEMLESDCAFLSRMNLMDYSLCLGIHDCERFEQEAADCVGGVAAVGSCSEEEEFGSLPPIPASPTRHSESNSTGDGARNSGGSSSQSGTGKRDPGAVPTPPDSPRLQHKTSNASEHELLLDDERATIDPNRDIYALFSSSGTLCFRKCLFK